MKPKDDTALTVAEIACDSAAMNEAVLASDFDEARFLAQLIIAKADAAGWVDVALDAAQVVVRLGPSGSTPQPGHARAMLALAETLSRVELKPPGGERDA